LKVTSAVLSVGYGKDVDVVYGRTGAGECLFARLLSTIVLNNAIQ